jgi:hypothetical protein
MCKICWTTAAAIDFVLSGSPSIFVFDSFKTNNYFLTFSFRQSSRYWEHRGESYILPAAAP